MNEVRLWTALHVNIRPVYDCAVPISYQYGQWRAAILAVEVLTPHFLPVWGSKCTRTPTF